ncbi:MAG: hypothetical protein UR83_C0061G0001, partial [Candidatus Moranbacteria bacterium GW2011_GWF2_35_54]
LVLGIFLGYGVDVAQAGCSGQCYDAPTGNWYDYYDCSPSGCCCCGLKCGNKKCAPPPPSCTVVTCGAASSICAGSSCTPVASNCSTGSTVYGTACCSGTCSGYTIGYNNWDTCHLDATLGYIQRGTSPISSGSYCGSCGTNASAVRGCGACNPAVAPSSVAPVGACLGGSVSGMTHNATNWTWNCLSGGAGTSANCSSVYIPSPNVSLVAPASVSLNNSTQVISAKQVNLSWNITNSATACPGGCACTASSGWSGSKSYPGNENATVNPGIDPTIFTLTCTNSFNGVGADSKSVDSYCDAVSWHDTTCSKNCGDGVYECHNITATCTQPDSCTDDPCNLGACPISSEWKEVRP